MRGSSVLKNVLLASALGLSAYAVSSADARNHSGLAMGWYVAVEGGASWIEDADGTVDIGPNTFPFEAQFDTGWAVLTEAGYRFESNWRVEFELGYRDNNVDCVSFNGGACGGLDADVSQFTQMVNVLYDVPLTDNLTLSLGAGFGGDFVTADTPFFKQTDFVVAGQLIAGLNLALTDSIDLFVNYRYFVAEDPHFDISPFVEAGFDDAKHTVTIGLRFDLDADEPEYAPASAPSAMGPPPPAPTGEPKRYVVFFGFNKANLTLKAQAVVAEAAATAKQQGSAAILVTGHTDTIGSNGYNQILSERRADIVKHELVRLGIPANSISAVGKGKTMLLVQTPDHTWEDRNRRATIDLN